jgi:hypothetical protein
MLGIFPTRFLPFMKVLMHPDEHIFNHYPISKPEMARFEGECRDRHPEPYPEGSPYIDIIYTYTYMVVKRRATYIWG